MLGLFIKRSFSYSHIGFGLQKNQSKIIYFRNLSKYIYPNIYTGTNNFYKLVTKSDYIVDKSLFIKEIIDINEDAILITRPRRWGKSLNFDMLKKFLNIEVDKQGKELEVNPYRVLFEGGDIDLGRNGIKKLNKLAIAKIQGNFMQKQGNWPVILLNLKECKGNNKQEVMNSIQIHIKDLFKEYQYLKRSEKLEKEDKELFVRYIEGEVNIEELNHSLSFLSRILHDHFKKQVWLLVDEHDKPGSHFMTLKDFRKSSSDRDEVIKFLTSMLARCGKDSPFIHRTVLTGVTDFIYREGASGFNNIKEVHDLNNIVFSDSYGLSKDEVLNLLDAVKLEGERKTIVYSQLKEWYDGYLLRDSKNNEMSKLNIWSVICHLDKISKVGIDITPMGYWSNSAMNDVLENICNLGVSDDFIINLHKLSQGEKVKLPIPDQNFSFMGNIDNPYARDVITSYILLHYGYLNRIDDMLVIPNKEVDEYFRNRILQIWIKNNIRESCNDGEYGVGNLGHDLCQNLFDRDKFLHILNKRLVSMVRGGDKSEPYFQTLIGGAIELHSIYNKNTANYFTGIEKTLGKKGRIDNIFYPKRSESNSMPVIIHEYKKMDKTNGKELDLIESAVWQIFANDYMSEPLTKQRVHKDYYNFNYIRLRGVLLIRDENTGRWSAMMEERDLSIDTAYKIVRFIKNNAVSSIIQLSKKNQNLDKSKIKIFEKLNINNVEDFIILFENNASIEDLISNFEDNSMFDSTFNVGEVEGDILAGNETILTSGETENHTDNQ